MDRYLELFLEESTEQIDLLNDALLGAERDGTTRETIEELFRVGHTLKSSAAFVGQTRMSELFHTMEDLLDRVRRGNTALTSESINLFFRLVDRVRAALVRLSTGESVDDDFVDLRDEIRASVDSALAVDAPAPVAASPSSPVAPEAAPDGDQVASAQTPAPEAGSEQWMTLTSEEEQELRRVAGERRIYVGVARVDPEAAMKNLRYMLLLQNLSGQVQVFKTLPEAGELEGDQTVENLSFIVYGDIDQAALMRLCQVDMIEDVRLREYNRSRVATRDVEHRETRVLSRSIKVSSEKIDYLMNNVGELVIINSGLQKVYDDLRNAYGEGGTLTLLKGQIDQVVRNARDLQSGIMKMRMIPVGLVFQRFTRAVRDLSQELGKQVDLEFFGEDTELDKNIIDLLAEPLLHLLRNALDHGIESPEVREAAGKERRALIRMGAYQSGNNVCIEVQDDGRGLNRDRILQRAFENGLYDGAADLTDEEAFDFIFQPGFSTAASVTDLSGRGVGMDVVRSMVEGFKGSIQVRSAAGEGTTFLLYFPLTLAIVSAILVECGGEEFAFPLADVIETVKVGRDEITALQGKEIINLRGDVLGVMDLAAKLGMPQNQSPQFPIVVVSTGNRRVGFIVDRLLGKREIVIKSLEQNYRSIAGLIGASILGDGRIILVLDVPGLVEGDRLTAASRGATADAHLQAIRGYQSFVTDLASGQFAVPLLEEEEEEREILQVLHEADAAAQVASVAPHPDLSAVPDAPAPVSEAPFAVRFLSSGAPEPPRQRPPVLSELTEADHRKLFELLVTGMQNAGRVLSELIGVGVDVTVPEFRTVDRDELSSTLAGRIVGVQVAMEGGLDGQVFLVFDQATGLKAAADLMGYVADETNQELPEEDVRSVLSELANIVGANLMNELSRRTGLTIMPGVPDFFRGGYRDLLHRIDTHDDEGDPLQMLYVMADFFRPDLDFFSRLLILPTASALARILNRL